jgi:hypothetical protein
MNVLHVVVDEDNDKMSTTAINGLSSRQLQQVTEQVITHMIANDSNFQNAILGCSKSKKRKRQFQSTPNNLFPDESHPNITDTSNRSSDHYAPLTVKISIRPDTSPKAILSKKIIALQKMIKLLEELNSDGKYTDEIKSNKIKLLALFEEQLSLCKLSLEKSRRSDISTSCASSD